MTGNTSYDFLLRKMMTLYPTLLQKGLWKSTRSTHHIYMTVKKKDVTSALLLVFYISMFLPWVFITRTVFIYQYFICTKVLILMICRSIQCIGFKHENSVIKLTAVMSTALFVVFFPVLSGVMVSMKYLDEILTMLPNWWF